MSASDTSASPGSAGTDRTGEIRRRISGLHVLTDARQGRDVLAVVAAAVAAGAPVVQVRVKGCGDRELYEFATRVVETCVAQGATCIVDDRVDIALAVGAAGTHLGAGDLPLAVARAVAGPDHLLGGTARTAESAVELVSAGADYLGVGPAYATSTKDGLPAALGPAGIGAVADAVEVPVIAIGGITVATVPQLLAAGALGVAVVSAVSDAADPTAATHGLLAALAGTPGRGRRPSAPDPDTARSESR